MSAKKWLVCFVLTALLLAAALAGFNLYTDPFGVFGDRFLDWYSFDETNNPRAAKLAYLRDRLDDYDSYVLGCSSTSSFSVGPLNEAFGASFYNMIVYGADMQDTEQLARWLLARGLFDIGNLIKNKSFAELIDVISKKADEAEK